MVYGGRIGPEDVAITAGCNLAFAAVAMTLARAGDAVIVPAPWYFNHQMTLAMLGVEARPLACRAEAGFVPDPDEAETLIDGTVRALVLVTPNNPTGAVYPPDLVARFAELCARRGIRLVLDETYRDFLPLDLDRAHGLLEGDAWREHVVQLYSFSKAYCMPGHRVGAITADTALIGQIAKVLDCLQICAARPAQAVLPWAIGSLSGWREGNRREIAARAEAFRSAMGRVPGWRVEQVGAYFAYVRHPFSGAPAARAAEALASRRGVLALPGSYFGPGQEGHLRMAFANVGSEVIEALPERLAGLALP
jgi:aspartate/methionine/tyrosine aminotransferase